MNIHYELSPDDPVVFHEYANLFPMMQGDALDALRADIKSHGVQEPVVFLDGAILDGRNRYQCARDLGLDYPRVDFAGADPLAYVISHNLHRRHLTESQRASIGARVANMGRGFRSDIQPTANLQEVESLPGLSLSQRAAVQAPVSQADAARMMNVSERSIATAKKVHENAPAEIVRAVDDGRISVSLAAKVADLPEAAQAEVIAAEPAQVKEVAQEQVKKAHVSHNSGENEWYTPGQYIDAARAVMGGIDLDPASSEIANRTVQAVKIFTAQDNGLNQIWPEGRVWMNPPYAQPLIAQFSQRFAEEMAGGCEGIALVNNGTETAWFQALANVSMAICFPRSRIKFLDPQGNPGAPLQGQAIIYSGPNADRFEAEFCKFGVVLRHG